MGVGCIRGSNAQGGEDSPDVGGYQRRTHSWEARLLMPLANTPPPVANSINPAKHRTSYPVINIHGVVCHERRRR